MRARPALACGVCERPMDKAKRVEAEVSYCLTCYARSFKRLLCGGCGMFKRLLAAQDNARCQACVAAMPCVRCGSVGRPLGKRIAQGPVCNSCYSYFIEPRPCEVCREPSRRLCLLRTADGDKKVCPRCYRADHHTCASCRKHRPCIRTLDGRWQCRRCREVGEVMCETCSVPMAAGNGKRCQACYWTARCEHGAAQLVELLSDRRVREAFMAFAAWLPTQGSAQRAAMKLARHVEFFEMLDGGGDDAWTGEFLLKRFGTATLRRYELPVRWLQSQGGVNLPAEDKAREADTRRLRTALALAPEGIVARELLEAFERELRRRHDAGKLTARSMRLAFRPAVALLAAEDPQGARAPTQAALERYLAETPGQRAALSTFLGFLRSSRGIELRLPAKSTVGSALNRKALEEQIADLMASPVDFGRIAKRWAPLALRYFHHLSATEAKKICAGSRAQPSAGGTVLHFQGQDYWIPLEPVTLSPPQATRASRVRARPS
jgi:hypothetical protein